MYRILADDRVKLTIASFVIQVANFLILVAAKTTLNDEGFSSLLAQLAIAGIIGTIASVRLEILLFQRHGKIAHATLIMPIASVVLITVFALVVSGAVSVLWPSFVGLSVFAVPLVLGQGLSEIHSFAFVQMRLLNVMLAIRIGQALLIGCLMASIVSQLWIPSESALLFSLGLCYALQR